MADEKPRPHIGFIGLGIMGRPMAERLLGAGYELDVHSRSQGPVDALQAQGATVGRGPAEVAERSDVIITMLPDTPDVEAVLGGPGGFEEAARPGQILVDMSTIDPGAARSFAARLGSRGVPMLDAPVSGGQRGAIDGTLSIMVGGQIAAFEQVVPILRHLGRTIVRVGESGAGQVAKAANQLVVAANIEAVAEALTLAARAGVDPAVVREVLLGGFAASRVLEVHGQRMIDGTFEPGFRTRLHAKDARIIRELAAAVDARIPAFRVVADALDELVAMGRGELDHSALVTLLEDSDGTLLRRDSNASPPS